MQLPYTLVDADNHYYEPYDCFTRHIEGRYANKTIRGQQGEDGLHRVYLGDKRLAFMSVFPGDYAGGPGALLGLFAGNQPFVQVDVISADDYPAFTNRDARLALMDEQGISTAVQLPTLGVVVEHEMRSDIELTYASLRAFNRWLDEDWGFAYQDRIFGVPLLSLLDVKLAVTELDRVLAAGARIVHLRPAPMYGRSPADPLFDPFWARLQEADVPVMFHVGNSGYQDLVAAAWGENPTRPTQLWSPLQWFQCGTDRTITDTLAALVLHNLFGRFPRLRVISVENGCGWAKDFLKQIDKAYVMGRRGELLGGSLSDKPSDIFRESIYICPFPEDDVVQLIDLIGADHVLFGSDFPHPEGLAHPIDFLQRLQGVDDDIVYKVMHTNAAGLLRLTN